MFHASVVWATLAVLITEGLGRAGWLTRAGLSISWAIVALIAALCLVRQRRARNADARVATEPASSGVSAPALNAADLVLLVATAAIVGLVGVVALVSPPNTWDVMEYHLPRVVHWLQNKSLVFYSTHELKQLHMTPGAEFLVLQLHGLAGSDRFDNLVQWFAYAGSVVGVTLIARSLGASARGQVVAAVVCATIPEGILQASGAKNDYVLTFWLVALAFYVLDSRAAVGWGHALGAGAALSLACLTKATAYVFAGPMLAAWALMLPARARLVLLKSLPVTVLLFAVVNAGQYARNYEFYRSVLGPAAESKSGDFKYTNDAWSPSVQVSNIVRNVALHMGISNERVDHLVERATRKLLRTLSIDPDDPASTWTHTRFELARRPRHESRAGNPAHLLLIGLALGFLTVRASRTPRDTRLFCLGLVLAFLAFCALLKWQPFHPRLHLPMFVLWSAPIAMVLTGGRAALVAYGVAGALLYLSTDVVMSNELRPLSGRHSTILKQDRTTGYFNDHHSARPSYTTAAALVRDAGCRHIGLDLSLATGQAYEYPLLVLLRSGRAEAEVRAVGANNGSERYRSTFAPCAVICARCATAPWKWRQYLADHPDTVVVGDFVLFLPNGAPRGPVPPELAAPIRLSMNGARLRPGDELVLGVQLWHPLDQAPADLYVGAFLPDEGQMVFLGPDRTLRTAHISAPSGFARVAPVPPGTVLDEPRLIELPLPKRGVPSGSYQIFAALARPGAFADNRIDPDDILALDMKHVVVSP